MIKHMEDILNNPDSKKKVLKSVPATKEEIKLKKELDANTRKAFDLLKDSIPERDKLWAMIQLRLNAFGENLAWNSKDNEIEFLEGDKEE